MRLLVTVGCLGALLVGCGPENTFQPPPAPTVTVSRPEVREVTTYDVFTGRTEAVETVEIRARVAGFLESIEFEPSDRVEAGQVLFTIEKAPFEARRDAAQASLAQAVATRDLMEATYLKVKESAEAQAASEIEVMEAEAKRDAAVAEVAAAEAALASAEIDLGYTTIKSPVAGQVSRDLVNIGNLVGASDASLLTTVVVDDPIHVYFNVDERTLLAYLDSRSRSARQEQRAQREVTIELLDGRVYGETGYPDFADNRVDPDTGTIQVRAVLPNPNGELYPGLFVRVRIRKSTGEAMLVPDVAIQRDMVGPYVLVVGDDGVVERRDVAIGGRDGRMRIVESGVDPDERVIVNGLQRAREGIEVDAEEAAPGAVGGDAGPTAEDDGAPETAPDGGDGEASGDGAPAGGG